MAKGTGTTCGKCGGGHATGSAVCGMSAATKRLVEKDNRDRAGRDK